jgi:PAS domain S-box-containing protein
MQRSSQQAARAVTQPASLPPPPSAAASRRGAGGWLQVTLVAAAYFVAGKLGLLLAVPPGYASAIFPGSGIAVAAALLFGRPALLGVGLGSFALNTLISLGVSRGSLPLASLLASGSIALGAVMQALAAARLARKYVGFPHPLDTGRTVARFLISVGPLACMVNGLWGPLSLLLAGAFAVADFPVNALTWWVGDVLGVVVAVPILFTFLAEPRALWRRRRGSVALPVALMFAVALLAFVRISRLEQTRIEEEFAVRAGELQRALSAQIESVQQVLESLRDLYGASSEVERAEFRHFVSGPLRRRPGLQALEWLPRVPSGEQRAFEQAAQGKGLSDFRIRPMPGAVPLPPLADSFPIYYAEPQASGQAVLGMDLASEPRRRRALQLAVDTGQPAASEPIELMDGPQAGTGFVLALAVYASSQSIATLAARRAALLGFVLAVFRMDRLVRGAIGDPAQRLLRAQLDDVTNDTRQRTLYRDPGSNPERARLALRLPLEMSGRHWLLLLSATPAYMRAQNNWEAWALLTVALVFCGILGGFLLVLSGRTVVLERASQDTAQLLSTLVQSSHDAIIAYDQAGLVVGWNAGAARSFGWQAEEVLGKSGDLFVPAELRAEHHERMQRAIGGESQPTFETMRVGKSAEPREFEIKLSPILGAAGEVRGASEICRDVTLAKVQDRALRASLREKEILLKEVHHRVKNNLQVISSLLNLQASYLPTAELRGLLAESQARVQSIALVHEQLYQSHDLAHIDFEAYIRVLVGGVFQAQTRLGQPIACVIEAGHILLDVDTSVPCGLIVNELITNALKHAFPGGRAGQIVVRLARLAVDRFELCVSDDGVGLPEGLDPRHTTSLGLELVFTLAEQLAAEVAVEREHGTLFRFQFSPVA